MLDGPEATSKSKQAAQAAPPQTPTAALHKK